MRMFDTLCFLNLLDSKNTLKSNIRLDNSTVHQIGGKKTSPLIQLFFFFTFYDMQFLFIKISQ